MQQCMFDEIVLFILETVSSEEYLKEIGIHRSKPITNWSAFKKKITNQSEKLVPGIYPLSFGRGGVHYYAVRQDGKLKKIGNGYSSVDHLPSGVETDLGKYAVGLDAQEDHSHGLCQTYALMFLFKKEKLLKKGEKNYFKNVLIGFRYLIDFINEDYDERERCWTYNTMLDNMSTVCKNHETERLKNLKANFKKKFCLTDLIEMVLNPKFRDNLKTWFSDDTIIVH